MTYRIVMLYLLFTCVSSHVFPHAIYHARSANQETWARVGATSIGPSMRNANSSLLYLFRSSGCTGYIDLDPWRMSRRLSIFKNKQCLPKAVPPHCLVLYFSDVAHVSFINESSYCNNQITVSIVTPHLFVDDCLFSTASHVLQNVAFSKHDMFFKMFWNISALDDCPGYVAASWRPWVPIHAIGALGLLFGAPGLPLGVLGVYFCGFKTFEACPGVRLSGTPFGTRFVVFLCPIWAPLASLLASLGCLLGGSWPLVRGPWEFLASFLVSLGSLRVSLDSGLMTGLTSSSTAGSDSSSAFISAIFSAIRFSTI